MDQKREIIYICFFGFSAIDKHFCNLQQQQKRFDIQVLAVLVEEQKTLLENKALAMLDEKKEKYTMPCIVPA